MSSPRNLHVLKHGVFVVLAAQGLGSECSLLLGKYVSQVPRTKSVWAKGLGPYTLNPKPWTATSAPAFSGIGLLSHGQLISTTTKTYDPNLQPPTLVTKALSLQLVNILVTSKKVIMVSVGQVNHMSFWKESDRCNAEPRTSEANPC